VLYLLALNRYGVLQNSIYFYAETLYFKSWKFFETGSVAGIQPSHASRLARQLARLNSATSPVDMNNNYDDYH